ncbi:DUF883 family protein [Jeongeupia naejangsanensis]|uniref:DUF883 domain-containing protein n=1 Tax=Jeongeupia naejangsanensis TaxID=613195 RepID=A0ABS2BN69_9NEIS|nr:DUF883 family protein [Jeongeupia naejangsanensis]MBM3117072.1 DUF883 domain-containing protein [Jeongeupia naejangsanensis]
MSSNGEANLNQEELIDDLRNVLAETESMLKEVASDGTEQGRALRAKIAANLSVAKDKLVETERLVAGKAKVAAKVTDEYVHENPWTSVGVAAGVGFLLGLLVSRR